MYLQKNSVRIQTVAESGSNLNAIQTMIFYKKIVKMYNRKIFD
jgi:hypothetical protein